MGSLQPDHIRANYHALVRRDVFPLVPKIGGTLLDVGGGIGATAAALKAEGYVDRAGVIDLVEHDSGALGLDFHISGDLEQQDFLSNVSSREGPFNVILCLDVLEHLSDPWDIVKKLHRGLAHGGVIIASIPNIRYYQASFPLFFQGRWELQDAGIRDKTHLRWFVRDTAISLMTSSGLKLDEVVGKPGGGRRIRMVRALTLGLGKSFTDLQYLIKVVNTGNTNGQ